MGVRRGLLVVMGGAAAMTAVCLPFFLAGPTEMWRMVVLDQVGRDQGTAFVSRAAQIATMGRVTEGAAAVAVVLVALVGLIAIIAWAAWVQLSACVLVEIMAAIRGIDPGRLKFATGGQQQFARTLVTSVAALASIFRVTFWLSRERALL